MLLDAYCAKRSPAPKKRTKRPAKKAARKRAARKSAALNAIDVIRAEDREGRHGGLVPIGALRRRMGLARAKFDRALLGLEKKGKIDLKSANDSRSLNPEDVIAISGDQRGRPGETVRLQYAVIR